MGLELKSPIIVGSCGLTRSLSNITEYEQLGAGAVVLKSLFQEEIQLGSQQNTNDISMDGYPEAYEYIASYSQSHYIDTYLDFIRDCKKTVQIPIIASVNCVTSDESMDYVHQMEKAGADALELNISILPSDLEKSSAQIEKVYFDILSQVKKHTNIPVAFKVSSHFSGLAQVMNQLNWEGMDGLVLFNRFYASDIDIKKIALKSAPVLSTPEEIYHTLRWVRQLAMRIDCDVASSTGVHDAEALIKMLLAGAQAVQVVSAIYKQGSAFIEESLKTLGAWMEEHKFQTTDEFIGKLGHTKKSDPAGSNRINFMKNFAGIQ